jgi:hypothetical protein
MTIDQIIALSASVAAALSAFATFLTVREMERQRELSHQPDLILLPVRIRATEEQRDSTSPSEGESLRLAEEIGLLTHWEAKNGPNMIISGRVAAALVNVGVGSAKDVHVSWDAPIESFAARINAMAQRALVPASYEYQGWMLVFKSDSLGSMYIAWGNERVEHLDFVLPVSTQGPFASISVPYTLIHLISAYLYFVQGDREEAAKFSIPPARVTITFRDIAGVLHNVTLVAIFEPIRFDRTECDARLVFRKAVDA